MNLNEDFKEFLQFLNSNNVRYLVIGGYAVAAHGHVRYTKDIDIWIDQTEANSDRLMRALGEFGFGSIGLSSSDFLKPDTVVQLGYPPRRIDLLTAPSGVTFQRCYENRMTVELDGMTIPFILLEDLKVNKAATGFLGLGLDPSQEPVQSELVSVSSGRTSQGCRLNRALLSL